MNMRSFSSETGWSGRRRRPQVESEAGRSPSAPLRHEEVPARSLLASPQLMDVHSPHRQPAGRQEAPGRVFGRLSDARRAGHQAIAKAIGQQLPEGRHRPGVGADQIARSGPPGGQRVDNDLGHLLRRRRRARRSASAASRCARATRRRAPGPRPTGCPGPPGRSPCPCPRSGWRWTRARRSRPGRRTGAAPGAATSPTASIPNFEAWYGDMYGVATRPPIELMKTSRPRARRSAGMKAWVTATWPIRFTSIWRRKSLSGSSSSGPPTPIPALFTRPAKTALGRLGYPLGGPRDVLRVGDVQDQRLEALRRLDARVAPRPLASAPRRRP